MPPNGWIKANNKMIANNTKNTGFKIYRYILKFVKVFSQNHAITKKIKLKINKYKVICFGDKMARMLFQTML